MLRITTPEQTIELPDELDRGALQAGWNTLVSTEGLTVEVFREAVEVVVADYRASVAEDEVFAEANDIPVPDNPVERLDTEEK